MSDGWKERAEAAEAELARVRELLDEILTSCETSLMQVGRNLPQRWAEKSVVDAGRVKLKLWHEQAALRTGGEPPKENA